MLLWREAENVSTLLSELRLVRFGNLEIALRDIRALGNENVIEGNVMAYNTRTLISKSTRRQAVCSRGSGKITSWQNTMA